MYDKKKAFDTDDVLALIFKILLAFAAVAAAVVAGLKIYEMIQSKRLCSICDCCDDEYYDDDDFCICDNECDCEADADSEEFAEKVAEVTEKEINPTEN